MSIHLANPGTPQVEENAYNKTATVLPGTGILPVNSAPSMAYATATWALSAIAPGANSTKAVTVAGVQPGDYVEVAFAAPLPPDVAVLTSILAAGVVTLDAVNNGTVASAVASVPVTVQVWAAGQVEAEEAMTLKSR